jgi:hypothetical protein
LPALTCATSDRGGLQCVDVGAGAEPVDVAAPVLAPDVSVEAGMVLVAVLAPDVSVDVGVVPPEGVEPPHATPKAPTPIVTARSAIIPAFFMVSISSTQSFAAQCTARLCTSEQKPSIFRCERVCEGRGFRIVS